LEHQQCFEKKIRGIKIVGNQTVSNGVLSFFLHPLVSKRLTGLCFIHKHICHCYQCWRGREAHHVCPKMFGLLRKNFGNTAQDEFL